MSDEKFELVEELLWHNDPPENEDEEPAEATASEGEEDGEEDPLAPLDDGGIKPVDADPG